LRIAYIKTSNGRNLFERRDPTGATVPNAEALNFLKVLESLGAKLIEIEEPTPNYGFLDSIILDAECGAAFEGDTLSGKIKELEPYNSWPNTFRAAQFVPGVDYVNANRARVRAMNQTWELFEKYDVVLSPAENTSVTNITGTPSIVIPTGFALPGLQQGRGGRGGGGGGGRGGDTARGGGRGADTARAGAPPTPPPPVPTIPVPTGMYVMGPIFQDEKNLLVAHAFQSVTDFHKKRPPQFV
jgi:Asp-tRNA(Asn)/Glu-tRNA(Gln) amidotransferase A subunit family amidase